MIKVFVQCEYCPGTKIDIMRKRWNIGTSQVRLLYHYPYGFCFEYRFCIFVAYPEIQVKVGCLLPKQSALNCIQKYCDE